MVVANVFRIITMVNCFVGLICLIPFKGITRIHPLLWLAMVFFGVYDVITLIAQLTLWNTQFSVRNIFAIVLSTGSLYWAFLLLLVSAGRKVRMWPFTWSVQAYVSPTDVWKGKTHVYRQGHFNQEGIDDQGQTGQASTV